VQGYWSIFPETYAPKPETLRFLDEVFDEVLAIFPGTFIHVGGDEAPKVHWETSPCHPGLHGRRTGSRTATRCRAGSSAARKTFLAARGRRLVGWDEIQEGGLAPGATMMAWRDVKWAVEAARLGHDVVIAPTSHTYFDYTEGSGEEEGVPIGAQSIP
jgi:hexosaminidase